MRKPGLNEVEDIMVFFRAKQSQYNKKMDFDGNIVQLKWDLRDVMSMIPEEHMKPLINFYLKNSDQKSIQDFIWHYHEYYKALVNYAKDRKQRAAIFKQTMERVNE